MKGYYGENASKHVKQAFDYLYEGEDLIYTYGVLLDYVALTNKRLMFVDKSVFSKKTSVRSIPYSRIESVSIENGEFWSRSNKLEIQTKSKTYSLEFRKGADIMRFYHTLVYYICN